MPPVLRELEVEAKVQELESKPSQNEASQVEPDLQTPQVLEGRQVQGVSGQVAIGIWSTVVGSYSGSHLD